MTRFEKIKEMTAEEFVDWLSGYMACEACPAQEYCRSFRECRKNLDGLLNEEEPEVCRSCAIDLGDDE